MIIIFRQDVATTCLKHEFDIESSIQEIPIVKQVYMKGDTDSFYYFFVKKKIKKNIYIYIYIYIFIYF